MSSDFYRFPAMATLRQWTNHDQTACILREAYEAEEAASGLFIVKRKGTDDMAIEGMRTAYGMELMDVIHACETALRIEFDENELEGLQNAVIEKNRKRGYYGD